MGAIPLKFIYVCPAPSKNYGHYTNQRYSWHTIEDCNGDKIGLILILHACIKPKNYIFDSILRFRKFAIKFILTFFVNMLIMPYRGDKDESI